MLSCIGQRRKVTLKLAMNLPFLCHVMNREWSCAYRSEGPWRENSRSIILVLGITKYLGRRITEKPGLYSELQMVQVK